MTPLDWQEDHWNDDEPPQRNWGSIITWGAMMAIVALAVWLTA